MIVSVFSDMMSFLCILMISNFLFAELNILQNRIDGKQGVTMSTAFYEQYTFMMGNVVMADDKPVKKILYGIFSLFIIIVNLNLLIAIISETFANVLSTMMATDAKGKADALQEIGGFTQYLFPPKSEEDDQDNKFFMHILKNAQKRVEENVV